MTPDKTDVSTVHHRPPGQSYKNLPFSRAILFLSLQKLYHHVHTV